MRLAWWSSLVLLTGCNGAVTLSALVAHLAVVGAAAALLSPGGAAARAGALLGHAR